MRQPNKVTITDVVISKAFLNHQTVKGTIYHRCVFYGSVLLVPGSLCSYCWFLYVLKNPRTYPVYFSEN